MDQSISKLRYAVAFYTGAQTRLEEAHDARVDARRKAHHVLVMDVENLVAARGLPLTGLTTHINKLVERILRDV